MKKTDNEKCTAVMEKYLELDRNQKVPLSVSAHLMVCKKCRREVRALRLAEKLAAEPLMFKAPLSDQAIQNVMMKIDPKASKKINVQERSFRAWTLAGIVLLFAMVFMVFASKNFSSRDLLMGIATVIAFFVTAYCVLYIVLNIDFFIKRISSGLSA